jgi:hypothetical protein
MADSLPCADALAQRKRRDSPGLSVSSNLASAGLACCSSSVDHADARRPSGGDPPRRLSGRITRPASARLHVYRRLPGKGVQLARCGEASRLRSETCNAVGAMIMESAGDTAAAPPRRVVRASASSDASSSLRIVRTMLRLVPSRHELRAGEDARLSKEQRTSRPSSRAGCCSYVSKAVLRHGCGAGVARIRARLGRAGNLKPQARDCRSAAPATWRCAARPSRSAKGLRSRRCR